MDRTFLETILYGEKYVPEQKNKVISGSSVYTMSDMHGDYLGLYSGMAQVAKDNAVLAYNGDWVNDYQYEEFAHNYIGTSSQEIISNYFKSKLTADELKLFGYVQARAQMGYDALREQAKVQKQERGIDELEAKSKDKKFQVKLQSVIKNLETEKGKELNMVRGMELLVYDSMMDAYAKQFAQGMNKYGVTVLFNRGNHEDAMFVQRIQKYLDADKKKNIIDMNTQRGYVIVKDTNGSEISIAGVTNSVQMMPYVQALFSEDAESYYAHMIPHGKDGMIQGDLNQYASQLKSLDLFGKNKDGFVSEYERIKKGNEKKSLDVLLSHGQVGNTKYDEKRHAYPTPYTASSAKLALDAKLRVEGHIHKSLFEKNVVRPTRADGVKITKENNEIKYERVQYQLMNNGKYDEHTFFPIKSELEKRIEELLEKLKSQKKAA